MAAERGEEGVRERGVGGRGEWEGEGEGSGCRWIMVERGEQG